MRRGGDLGSSSDFEDEVWGQKGVIGGSRKESVTATLQSRDQKPGEGEEVKGRETRMMGTSSNVVEVGSTAAEKEVEEVVENRGEKLLLNLNESDRTVHYLAKRVKSGEE